MIDTKKLLDQFLGAGGAQAGEVQGGLQGGLAGLANSDIGKAIQGSLGGLGEKAGAAGRSLGGGGLGGLAGGALAGGLVSVLLGSKKVRKIGGKVLTYGGLAAVGAIAYTAYRNWQAGQSQPQPQPQPHAQSHPASAPPAARQATSVPVLPPPETPFHPASTPGGEQALAHTLVHAMIVAAKADGHVDDAEKARILSQLERFDIDADERTFLDAELSKPLDIDGVVASATTPELAAEIYAASLLVLDGDTAVGGAYLALLAARLKLDPGLKAALEDAVAAATAA